MNGLIIVVAGVVAFTAIVLALVATILVAKSALVASGNVEIEINGDASKKLSVPSGGKLLPTLADQGIFVPSACGGGGTCGQCKVRVLSGGGEILPTELSVVSRKEAKNGVRLACQTPVKENMKIEIPAEIFSARKFECVVRSNRFVATFLKELILELPEGEDIVFPAGGYAQLERPAGTTVEYENFRDEVPELYRADWDKFNLWRHVSVATEDVSRAYSLSSYPLEKGVLKFVIRLAAPLSRETTYPPGLGSSYFFNLKPGDKITVGGPYGEFLTRDTPNEKIYLGRGAGMAPLRSHILDMLERQKRTERISFWYGARTVRETFYVEEFRELEKKYPNFSFHLAVSKPLPEENWTGMRGLLHEALYNNYLKDHKAPEDCEYFICGSKTVTDAILKTLDNLGVERDSIFFDDFGN